MNAGIAPLRDSPDAVSSPGNRLLGHGDASNLTRPMPLQEYLRSLARAYCLTANTIRYRIEYRVIVELISEYAEDHFGEVILDAGAGSGEISRRLQADGFCKRLVGVEPFEDNYRLLVRNYGDHPDRECHRADLFALPVADGAMDALISTQVFEHIEDHEAAADEVARVVKSSGLALISTPHPPELFPNDGHVRPGYTREEMDALFGPHGFEHVGHRYFFTKPTLERLVKAARFGKLSLLLPIGWADREKHLSQEEIFAQQPYGIACLYRKHP